MIEKKKGIWQDVINKANEDFDGGTKQMWVGIEGYWAKNQKRQTQESYIKSTKRLNGQ